LVRKSTKRLFNIPFCLKILAIIFDTVIVVVSSRPPDKPQSPGLCKSNKQFVRFSKIGSSEMSNLLRIPRHKINCWKFFINVQVFVWREARGHNNDGNNFMWIQICRSHRTKKSKNVDFLGAD
jgi:hypothetical protein